MRKILSLLLIAGFIAPSTVSAVNFNDPENNKLWYLDSLQMSEVWEYSQGEDITVAVIDSGLDMNHIELVNQLWINEDEVPNDGFDNDQNGYVDDYNGYDFLASSPDLDPKATVDCIESGTCDRNAFNHGTIISGIVAAETDNSFGISGLAPQANIMGLRVLSALGEGFSNHVVGAIDYAIANGADVINMSFVGPEDNFALNQAVERAYLNGIPVIIAAGNEEVEGEPNNLNVDPRYPVCNVGITGGQRISMGVASHDEQDRLSTFSNYGSDCVDILAPGDDIFGIVVQDPDMGLNPYFQDHLVGTSLSAPVVAGIIALIRSYAPELAPGEIYDLIEINAENVNNKNPQFVGEIGAGKLDALSIFQSLPVPDDLKDDDSDGHRAGDDCNDSNATIFPGAPEVADDGIDQDCDGQDLVTEEEVEESKPFPLIPASPGDLVKASGNDSVYYLGADGKRYAFPDLNTFLSWHPDFSFVVELTSAELATVPLGGVVTYRPGINLIKIESDPKVYAVEKNGVLRWIENESVAKFIYGDNWATKVRDISVSFFTNYKIGPSISHSNQYDLVGVITGSRTINDDKSL